MAILAIFNQEKGGHGPGAFPRSGILAISWRVDVGDRAVNPAGDLVAFNHLRLRILDSWNPVVGIRAVQ